MTTHGHRYESDDRPRMGGIRGVAATAAVLLALSLPAGAQEVAIFGDGFEWGDVLTWQPPTVLRFTDLDLLDPHLYEGVLFLCIDGTGLLNDDLAADITGDADGDGLLDLSSLLQLRPLLTETAARRLDVRAGDCLAPHPSPGCTHFAADPQATQLTYAMLAAGTCLAPLPGTTGGYSPGVTAVAAPCFVTQPTDLVLALDGAEIPLRAGQIAGTLTGPPWNAGHGLLLGFVREADADLITLPGAPGPLSSSLPGGTGNCAPHDDRDELGGESGWWFYFSFTAAEVAYDGY